MDKYYRGQWSVLEDGGSSRWVYSKTDGRTHAFIIIHDFVDYCGRDADYHIDVTGRVVDVRQAPLSEIKGAFQCCDGAAWGEPQSETEAQAWLAQMLLEYGTAGVVFQEMGLPVTDRNRDLGFSEAHPVFKSLRAQARKALEPLLNVAPEERDDALEGITNNALGASALHFLKGQRGGDAETFGQLLADGAPDIKAAFAARLVKDNAEQEHWQGSFLELFKVLAES